MENQGKSINVMNAQHMAMLAYMQRYIHSITKEGKQPGEVITVRVNDEAELRKKT
jgi:hypothetical protein